MNDPSNNSPANRRAARRREALLRFRPGLLLPALLLLAVTTPAAEAGLRRIDPIYRQRTCLRAQDEMWIVNARRVGCVCTAEASRSRMIVNRRLPGCGWQPSSLEALLQSSDPHVRTLIYVHGNRIDPLTAQLRGQTVYRNLVRHDCSNTPIRFVVFSWPSSPIRGLLKDSRVKARRTLPAAFNLASLVDALPADTPLGMMGHSYGARVITGSLHLLAGCPIDCYRLSPSHTHRLPVRVALLASAVDDDWMLPGRPNSAALSQVERMLLLNNSYDPILRRYRVVDEEGPVGALGYRGIRCPHLLGSDLDKIVQHDISHHLGRAHSLAKYLSCVHLTSRAWRTLVPEASPQPTAVAALSP